MQQKILAILWEININNTNKKVAFVHCNGHCNNVIKTYEYNGPHDCNIVKMMPNNGDKKWVDYNKEFNRQFYDNTYAEKCANCNFAYPMDKLYELPKNK